MHRFRPDVQGLRALAVTLVVVYHLFPSALPGGYVGVDLFFVISGFLITGQLLHVLQENGRISLIAFYGRRARRLLPAAALVLAVTWLASRFLLPITELPAAAHQIRASALYFQNWVLAGDAVDYLKAGQAPSPVEHYWSLSIEEQFYLVWPLLFLIAAVVARREGRQRAHTVLIGLAGAILVASLACSAELTHSDPPAAYFVTTTRMWELAAGGLLALLGERAARILARQSWLGWAGLGLVLASAFVLTGSSAFPGTVAIVPVTGSVLLIACGSRAGRFGPWLVTARRPAVFLGGTSYAVYLWHWPMIVLYKGYLGQGIGLPAGLAIAAGCLVLAWLTKLAVEDPLRNRPFIAQHRWRSLATASAVVIPVAMVSVFIAGEPQPWHGPLDRAHPGGKVLAGYVRPVPPARILPPVQDAVNDVPDYEKTGCIQRELSSAPLLCSFGDTSHPTLTVALVGDSMAGQWLTSLESIAKKRHWEIKTELHNRCPFSAAMTIDRDGHTPYTSCYDWGKTVEHQLLTSIRPDVVLTSDRPTLGTPDHPQHGRRSFAQIGAGMAEYWKKLITAGIKVVPIRETPEMGKNEPDCLSSHTGTVKTCSTPAKQAIVKDPPTVVAEHELKVHISAVDMNSVICGPTICEPVVGNVEVYRDSHHLTSTYTRTLTRYLDKRLISTNKLA